MRDVVQTVLRFKEEYLIGKRIADGYWEFLGGKLEKGESIREAALRELKEETGKNLKNDKINIYKEGKPYTSERDSKYRLNPVLLDLNHKIDVELSSEHSEYEWITLDEYHRYETLGQYQAIENLDIVNGDVSIGVVENNGDLLVLKRAQENSSAGYWNFPGGKIEADETREESVLRELEEETGLKGEIKDDGEYFIGAGELGYWRIYPFLLKADGEVELNHEHSVFKWVEPEKINDLKTLGTGRALEILEIVD